MDAFTTDDLRALMGKCAGLCVSIYMPTFRAGVETQQNPIRLRNLLEAAQERLVASGMRAPEAQKLLQPAMALLDNGMFWRNQGDGLAVFVSEDKFQAYRVPQHFREQVVVNDRFHIKPMLALFRSDGHFYVLALSQNRVRLLEGTKLTVSEMELETLPKSLADALKYDDFERQLQYRVTVPGRSPGREGVIFHGHGGIKDVAKNEILRYFQQIDRGLHELLREKRTPLVLAGVDYLLPIYREANRYNHLLKEGIEGNPELDHPQTIHGAAWAIVEPYFRRVEDEAIGRYRELAGTGRASADARQVVAGAYQGRVDVLLVSQGAEVWGMYDPETTEVTLGQDMPRSEELSDHASLHTILNGGEVHTLTEDRMPEASPMAAVFRY